MQEEQILSPQPEPKHNLVKELLGELIEFDRGLWLTFRTSLSEKAPDLVAAYMRHEKRYTYPIRYLLTTAVPQILLMTLFLWLSDRNHPKLTAQEQFVQKVTGYLIQFLSLVYVACLPLMSIVTRAFNRKRESRFYAHFAINTYSIGTYFLLNIPVLAICYTFLLLYSPNGLYEILSPRSSVGYSILVITYVTFFSSLMFTNGRQLRTNGFWNWARELLIVALGFLISYLCIVVVLTILLFLGYFIAGRFF